ncbi:MAG: sugar ABC transporter ATP-binding protein [Actinobacteria bacterium]|nr:sugar ABC transporter ATP-binding protein [Actinomycetota bacterium]
MTATTTTQPIVQAKDLSKSFGRVVGLADCSFELYPGEVLAVVGDNGAGKSTLIKCLSGALSPDSGEMYIDGEAVTFKSTNDSRAKGVETVYQTLAVAPVLDISENLYLGREIRKKGILGKVFRSLDKKKMRAEATQSLNDLGVLTVQSITQSVETLSGGQRQAVAVARAGAFGSKVVILDEPTAALGVNESARVLKLIKDLRERGMSIILISHNMPQVFDVADRIHVQRLGRRAAVVTPQSHQMNEVVAIMTGAMTVPEAEQQLTPVR